ncbi:WXG100 family type VII secretion target, partial [Rathayibacter iranicus NCPPB 2253 = VKM Ac-1602]
MRSGGSRGLLLCVLAACYGLGQFQERERFMAQISVTPEELKQQAQVYTRSKEEIEQAIQKVNQMNSTIGEEWKGQAF